MRKILIAIDGPAGSGKSTTAKLVARRLGYVYVDTGAMYRAVTLKVLTSNVDPANETAVVEAARGAKITFRKSDDSGILLDGKDVAKAVRSEDITRNVSLVSSYPEVRKLMVAKQREIGSQKSCVMDGRDIGTVVFPNADLKFYVTADIMERAHRRQEELSNSGIELPIHRVVKELEERDLKDSTRDDSPLKRANDAIELDTTNLTIAEQVQIVLNYVNDIVAGDERTSEKTSASPKTVDRHMSGHEEMQRR